MTGSKTFGKVCENLKLKHLEPFSVLSRQQLKPFRDFKDAHLDRKKGKHYDLMADTFHIFTNPNIKQPSGVLAFHKETLHLYLSTFYRKMLN